jgi:HD-like signal output (HDOD) protein
MLGATHAEIAAYLIGLWGIKFPVVEAIAFHHKPDNDGSGMGLLAIVHTANALAHEIGSPETSQPTILDEDYLKDTDLMGRYPVWQSACQAHIQKGEHLEG